MPDRLDFEWWDSEAKEILLPFAWVVDVDWVYFLGALKKYLGKIILIFILLDDYIVRRENSLVVIELTKHWVNERRTFTLSL